MFIIKTQSGRLVNMDHIEGIQIVGDELLAVTPCFNDNGDYDQYQLYKDGNKEHLDIALDALFNAMTNDNIFGFDFTVTSWEVETND